MIREKKFDPETGEEIEEEEPELEEGEKKSFEGYIKDPNIFPSSCIVLKQSDDFLINRVKKMKQKQVEGTHYNPMDMVRRLKTYRELNESQIAEPSVTDFFRGHNI